MKKLEMLTALSLVISSANTAPQNRLIIKQQGSFAVDGVVKISDGNYNSRPEFTQRKTSNDFIDVFKINITNGGQTLHGDHATVSY